MKVIKPPMLDNEYDPENLDVFLAGSIEMGRAWNWQDEIADILSNVPNVNLFNPRRVEWDSSWDQDIKHEKFFDQVTWELDHLTNAHLVVFCFDPATRSPVTLMELGLAVGEAMDIIVCCPQGFYRKGNVDILCQRYDIKQVDNLNELAEEIIRAALERSQYVKDMV